MWNAVVAAPVPPTAPSSGRRRHGPSNPSSADLGKEASDPLLGRLALAPGKIDFQPGHRNGSRRKKQETMSQLEAVEESASSSACRIGARRNHKKNMDVAQSDRGRLFFCGSL